MWCSAADTHLKILDRVVSDQCQFKTGGVFECDLTYHRSVAVLCTLYKIMCNPMHHRYGALHVPCLPVQVILDALVALRYTYETRRRITFVPIPLSVSLWNDLVDPVFNGVGLAGSKSKTNVFFYWPSCSLPLSSTVLPFTSFFLWVRIVGLGSLG